jgi:hypothetical protein
MEDDMHPEDRNISTDYQPKGSDRNQSDTLDRKVDPDHAVARPTDKTERVPGDAAVVDEKGRPLTGDGLIDKQAD